jgi:GNAT superfamily N-acetyltransferase
MLTIRRYQPADQEAVWALHKAALRAAQADLGNGARDDDLRQIEDVYLNAHGEFLVGSLEDRLVAMGALRQSSEHRAEIKRMRVYPDCQRKGFGQAILTALEQRAKELGYSTLHLDTTTVQEAAQRFYTKNGYIEVRRGQAHGFHLIFYEKRVW